MTLDALYAPTPTGPSPFEDWEVVAVAILVCLVVGCAVKIFRK